MKNKLCIILFLSVVAFSGCVKGWVDTSEAGEPLVFSASASSTKAVFADPLVSGDLVWSPYDNLGVYSFDVTNGTNPVHSGFASMSSYEGNDAIFTSTESRATWAGGATDLHIYAYYPQMLAPQAPCVSGTVSLRVPTAQNGDFGKFHICWAQTDISANDLTAGRPVSFAFNPATSMLRVKPVLHENSVIDEIYIKQLVIKIADNKRICGDTQLTLSSGVLSSGTESTVNVVLSPAVRITKTEADNPFFTAVLLPAYTDNSILSFYVIDNDGNKFTMSNKLSPAQFLPGTRYSLVRSFLVNVYDGEMPDGRYIDGGYGWDYEPVVEDGAYTDAGFGW